MGAIFMLAGGLVGFASAFVSLVVFDASLLMALAIWSGAGMVFCALGLALALLSTRAAPSGSRDIGVGTQGV
ncbi:MAG: hypothetical protein ACK4HF_10315 [Paracoccaceae bacterium]